MPSMSSSELIRPVLSTSENVRVILHVGRLSHATDAELVRFCRSGDRSAQDALEELARRFQAPLFRFLFRLMGSKEDAEEAVLEVFLRVWKHSGNFRHQASVSTWLYRIAANIARDHHARFLARPKTDSLEAETFAHFVAGNAETEAMQQMGKKERSLILHHALETLNTDDRLVLVLYYLEAQEYAEMQAITGWIYPVLKTRLVRARIRLRKRLKELGFEESL